MPWLVIAALGLAAGDAMAMYSLPPAVVVLTATAGAVLLLAARRGQRVGALLLAGTLGFANADAVYRPTLAREHIASYALPATLELEGVLASDAEQRGELVSLLLDTQAVISNEGSRVVQGRVSVSLRELTQQWHAGDRLRATLSLRRPRNFGNPAEFDFERHLARHGIYVTAFAESDRSFDREPGSGWSYWMSEWRRRVRQIFYDTLPVADAQLLCALILGTARELPEEMQDAFRRTGTSHVLAISGLNITMVAAASYGCVRWLLARSETLLLLANVPKLATCFSLLPVLIYASIAGSNLATLRALIMLAALLGAVLVDRAQRPAGGLAIATSAILLAWPGSVLDASFQLSFVAVLSLTLLLERFWPWWRERAREKLLHLRGWRGKAQHGLASYLAVSGAAMLPTVPLVAFHFNQVSLVAPIANAIVVPLLGSVAVGLGMIAALLSPFSTGLSQICTALTWPALAAGRVVVAALAQPSWAAVDVVSLSPLELGAILVVLLGGFVFPARVARSVIATALVVLAVDLGWCWHERFDREDLRVTFLSVGQGDCAVVQLPHGEVMIVDGGGLSSGTFDVGERVVAPFLWSRKIGRVDYVVLSHPDWDHYGGLRFIAEHFRPREFWWSGRGKDAPTFRALQASLAAAGTRIVTLEAGAHRMFSDVDVNVLAPERLEGRSVNDTSLVLALAFAGHSILLAGDAEADAENGMGRSQRERLHSTILKVPHHGSRTSSTSAFLDLVQPQLAVVSVGFRNRFSFPNGEVMRRYAAIGAQILRTDVHGAVEVQVQPDGRMSVKTQREEVGSRAVI